MKTNEQKLEHFFNFSPKEHSGESLTLKTEVVQNGDGSTGVYLRQTLTLQSYFNSASFNLSGITLTPESLRRLASELEVKIEEAKKLV